MVTEGITDPAAIDPTTGTEPEGTMEAAGETETTEYADVVPTETEETADPVQELYDNLMACTTLDEINAILCPETEEEQAAVEALVAQFTEEQNEALSAKMEELGAYDVELDGATSESITISSIAAGNYYTVFKGWDKGNTTDRGLSLSAVIRGTNTQVEGFRVEAYTRASDGSWQGYKLWVGNSVDPGTYTVTVFYLGGLNADNPNQKDTLTVTVINNNVQAGVYYLLSPTGNPASNAVKEWSGRLGYGTIDKRPSSGATYTNSKNNLSPDAFVITMPSGLTKQTDGSYILDKNTYPTQWNEIWTAYKSSWEAENDGVTLSEDDVVNIYIKPYKLSQANADTRTANSDPDHIDCTVSVKLKNIYGVRFYVTKPGKLMTLVDSTSYKTNEAIQKTTKAPTDAKGNYPETLVVDGVTYKFDGWYNEAGTKVAESGWPYTPNENELTDGFVDFFAKYVPATYTLTITKEVSGNMLSHNDSFGFTVSGNVAEADKSFTLKHGETKTITVTVGDEITITEASGNYTTTYQIGSGAVQEGNVATITVSGDETISFVNTRNVTIDTGVILDTLPYILILAVVVIGVVALTKRRRSRDDD